MQAFLFSGCRSSVSAPSGTPSRTSLRRGNAGRRRLRRRLAVAHAPARADHDRRCVRRAGGAVADGQRDVRAGRAAVRPVVDAQAADRREDADTGVARLVGRDHRFVGAAMAVVVDIGEQQPARMPAGGRGAVVEIAARARDHVQAAADRGEARVVQRVLEVAARDLGARAADQLAERRQRDRREHGDDRERDDEFDEGETALAAVGVLHREPPWRKGPAMLGTRACFDDRRPHVATVGNPRAARRDCRDACAPYTFVPAWRSR